MNFIKTGIIPLKFSQLYTTLMDYRQMGDYGDMVDFVHEDIEPLMEPVEELIGVIRKLI